MPLSQRLQTTGHLIAVQLQVANRHIWRALLSLVFAALLLRLGGMVNQVVISAKFGAGSAMDAYFVAAAFPLLLIQLISSAIEAAVIPVYSQLRVRASKEAISGLFSTLLNGLVLGATLLALVLFVLRRQLVFLSAPGLDAARLDLAGGLMPLFILVIPPGMVIGLLECVLNAEGQFGWPAYAGLLVPLVTTLLALLGGRIWGIEALCLGVFLGTLCQLAIVCVRVRRARLCYRPVIDARDPHLWRILRAALPVLLGAFISQGGPLVDQVFASTLPAGSISALNYALKLVGLCSGVIFVSIGRAVLPYLARQATPGDPEYRAFKRTLRLYLWVIGLCALALSLLLLILARPLVQVLFQRGAFSAADTRSTVFILSGFAVGLMPMAIVFLLTRAFNALGETRIPMYVACVSVCANAVFDALFASFWQGFGIALATSVVSCLSCGLLLCMLSRRIGTLHLWHLPDEILTLAARLRQRRQPRSREGLLNTLSLSFYAGGLRQGLLIAGLALPVLAAGVYATVRDGLTALRVAVGMLIALCFLRYPFLLLLAWASIDVGIGSSLTFLNGNNLDLLLIAPLLLLLWTLPWREVAARMPGLPWLALYLAWVLAGIGLSPLDTRTFLTFWLTMIASMGVGGLVIGLVTTRRRLQRLIDTLLATALLVALYGLYGSVTYQRGEIDPETQLFRITSLFTQATTFAFYLSSVIPLALYRCWTLQGAKRLACASVAFCLLAALALTFTRSAYISLLPGLLLMALCLPERGTRLCIIAGLFGLCGLAVILAVSGHLPFLGRFLSGDIATLNGRIYLWQALLSRFQITQWLGNGLLASDQVLAYLRVGNDGQGLIGAAPHSLFLGTLYDHGLIGLLLLCASFLSIGRRLLKGIRRSSGERRMLYAAALAALVSVLLQSLGSRDLWIQAAGLPFWIAVALPFALCWSQSEATLDTREKSVSGLPGSALEIQRVPVPVSICIC